MRCAVSNCGNNNRNSNRRKWRYFHFPKEELHLQKWIDFCQRDSINPATACICNEHFAPEDFERNMQFELGFTQKNPTKLKPGSFPSVKGPQKLGKEKRGKNKKDYRNKSAKIANSAKFFQEEPQSLDAPETIEIQLCDFTTDLEDLEENSSSVYNEVVDLISENSSTSSQQSKEDNLQDQRHLEVEILDPMNPQANDKDHVEIIDSEGDNYVKHLELEVCSLKREVFFLKDERKKLMDEIQNLKATIQKSEVEKNAGKQLELHVKKSKRNPQDVVLFTD
ncbi:uncharacterized protein LOC108047692 [Drosophila rhopaloa]|uniref:Uncharacterized protein LOC108047692 n=1 Tax=Drosophila rhopaloa TaxID=1041015 RepID=A0A6P4F395_DRORH|nr:uncharacterized protein LOC108047692 [Drosophila rhopaloa]